MKKIYLLVFSILTISFSSVIYANWYADIIRVMIQQSGITNGFLSSITSQESQILTSQQNIEELMRQVHGSVTGNSGWGTYQFHDYQSYGDDARNWSDVMRMAENGRGSGALGQVVGEIANQFPSDTDSFNRGVSDTSTQNYYALKAETVLAARAASQLDFNKIQDQITYQQMLQQQIEKTKDVKAAIDLSNRIQVEGNLITLEILRQSALSNQQQAISDQAVVYSALSNARFLTKK